MVERASRVQTFPLGHNLALVRLWDALGHSRPGWSIVCVQRFLDISVPVGLLYGPEPSHLRWLSSWDFSFSFDSRGRSELVTCMRDWIQFSCTFVAELADPDLNYGQSAV